MHVRRSLRPSTTSRYALLALLCGAGACGRASPDQGEASSSAFETSGSTLVGAGNLCVGLLGASSADGVALGLRACDDSAQQTWSFRDDGTVVGPASKCLDVSGSQTGNGIQTYLWTCNQQVNQGWLMRGQELLSWDGRCLDTAGESSTAGAGLVVTSCNGAATQQWTFSDPSLTGTAPDAGGSDASPDAANAADAAPDAAGAGGSVTIPGDGQGTTALRVADLMESFGANVYSDQQDGASGETVDGLTKVEQYLTGSSGLTMMFRGYVDDAGDYDAFGPQLFAATGGKFSLCMGIGDQPSPAAVISLAQSSASQGNWIRFIEGGNEPNTDFGAPYQTGVSASSELPAVQAIFSAVAPTGIAVAAPSVVGSATGIAQYWGDDLGPAVAATGLYNSHMYPNNGGPNGANQLHDWSAAVQGIWGGKKGIISEWQPVLYNRQTDDASAAYWTPIMLLSSVVDFQVEGIFWWGLFDYPGFTPHVGLFRDDVANPYPAAMALKAMYTLTGDVSSSKHTFTPGKLDFTVTGLPGGDNAYAGGRSALFQNAAGEYFLFVWNEQDALATGASSHVTVTFNSASMSKVVDYSLTNPASDNPVAKQTLTDVKEVSLELTTEVRLLQITHP